MWQSGLCNMKLIVLPFILGFALALPSQGPPAPRSNCIRMTPEKEQQIDLIVEKLANFLSNLSIEHEHFDIRLIKLSIEQHTENEVEEKETVLQLSVNDCQLSDDELEEIEHHKEKAKQREEEREVNKAKLKREQQTENEKLADTREHKSENLKNKQETQENKEHSEVHKQTKEETEKELEKQPHNENSDAHKQKEAEPIKKVQEIQVNNDNAEVHEKTHNISKTEHENLNTDDRPEAFDQKEVNIINNNDKEAKSGKNFKVMYLDLDENGQKIVEAIGKKKRPQIVYVQDRNSGQTEYWFLKRR